MRPLAPDHIAGLTPYAPGKPISEVQRELGIDSVIKLASNENPLGPSPKAVEAVQLAAAELHLYPDGGSYYLKDALAQHFDVSPDTIMLGNGSNELLEMIIQAFVLKGTNVVTSQGTFIVYKLATTVSGREFREAPLTTARSYDLDAVVDQVNADTRLVCIANPNNPTGSYVQRADFESFIEKIDARAGSDSPVLVIDEAYFEYVDVEDPVDAMAILADRPRTIVLRTFSKAYGLAGLRCGYGFATPDIVAVIDRVRAPFNINSLAQAGCIAALSDAEFLERAVAVNRDGKAYVTEALSTRGVTVAPSQTNFVLADFHTEAKPIYEGLMRQGVITRPMVGYGLPTCLRISIGLPEENKRLIEAVDRLELRIG